MPTSEDPPQEQHAPEPRDDVPHEDVPPELADRLGGLRRTAILAGLVVGATVVSNGGGGGGVPTISFW